MVATSLPFWIPPAGRVMSPFIAEVPPPPANAPADPARMPRAVEIPAGVVIERCAASGIERHAAAWRDLAGRALEPNAFMEPSFALPATLHVAPAQRPRFLLAWDHRPGERPVLVGVLAMQPRRVLGTAVAAAWQHPQWVTSAPLLDRTRAAAALDAMLDHLAADPQTRDGLLLAGLRSDGALMALLTAPGRRPPATLGQTRRAVLHGGDVPAPALSGKRLKEMRRQRRRLGEGCTVRSAHSVDEVRAATEQFLDLEARGWKGRRGTAMLCDTRLATFVRAMTRLMAGQGLCRIDTLEVEGRTVAVGIVLRSGDRAFFWKTAFDETQRRHSPGKLLAEAIGARQRDDTGIALTDSCAVQDHPMIDHLWPDRMTVADVLVGGTGASSLGRAAGRLRLARTLRAGAKTALHALRRRLGRG